MWNMWAIRGGPSSLTTVHSTGRTQPHAAGIHAQGSAWAALHAGDIGSPGQSKTGNHHFLYITACTSREHSPCATLDF